MAVVAMGRQAELRHQGDSALAQEAGTGEAI